jgi:hypothetical protein
MRFHAKTDNTANYLQGANNFPYGAPPKLEDNEISFTWDDVPTHATRDDDDTAKCFSCGGWFPVTSCVINHVDDGSPVPVCETCADGRVG